MFVTTSDGYFMLKNFDGFLRSDETTLKVDKDGQPTPRDLKIAIVVLLLDVAHHDGSFSPEEVRELVRAMNQAFEMSDIEVADILEVAEILHKNNEKVKQFISAINEHFDDGQRQVILAMLWKLVKADGKIEKIEQQHAIKLRTLLGLSLEQATRAVQMVDQNEV